jgi:ferredoxin
MIDPKSSNAQHFTINMQPVGRRASILPDQSLLEAAQSSGVELTSICGGIGACDSCKIKLIAGQLTDPNLIELETFTSKEIAAGFRLACQAFPLSDVTVDIPPESLSTPQRLQIEGQGTISSIDPLVISIQCKLDPPSITDLRSDTTRLSDTIYCSGISDAIEFDHALVTSLSPTLRQASWN